MRRTTGARFRPGGSRMTSPFVGRPAAPFALRDTAGREHRLDTYRGRWLLLVLHRHLF